MLLIILGNQLHAFKLRIIFPRSELISHAKNYFLTLVITLGNQLHAFKQQNQLALSWLEEKEAVLNNDDIGDSLAAVEALIR